MESSVKLPAPTPKYISEPEAIARGTGLTQGELIQAFSWYNDNMSDEKLASALDIELSLLKNFPTYFRCKRLMDRGFTLPHKSQITFGIMKLRVEASLAKREEKQEAKAAAPVVNIQDATRAKALVFLDAITVQYDKLLHSAEPFNWYEFVRGLDIKGAYIPHIIDVIRTDDKKYADAPERWDPIITDLEKLQAAASASRSPRKKKAVKAEKVVSKITYLKEHVGLKIKSINPEKIVGAQELWVYMTERKYLSHFVADGPNGLTMSGSTVKGFNPELSLRKKLRKPDEILKLVLESRSSKARKEVDKLTTKTKEVSGRINEETLLLKVGS